MKGKSSIPHSGFAVTDKDADFESPTSRETALLRDHQDTGSSTVVSQPISEDSEDEHATPRTPFPRSTCVMCEAVNSET